MSIELRSRTSHTINDDKKFAKALVPYVCGIIVSIFIWITVISTNPNVAQQANPEYVGAVFLITILITVLVITIIKLLLIYLNRIVKMRPKSSYHLENIDHYLNEVDEYRNGDYEYGTIKTDEDIIESFAKGKVLVFTAIQDREKTNIRDGIIIMVFTYVILTITVFSLNNLNGIRIPILIYGYSLVFVIVGGSSILPNLVKLKRIKRSFFVLAPEGIVFRRIWGGIRAYSWKELDLTVHMVKRRSMFAFTPKYLQFNIALPNCAELFFKPKNYTHKEFVSYEKTQTSSYRTRNMKHVFLSESEKRIMNLIETAFNYYCDLGKLDLEEQLEAYMRFKRKV